MARDKMYMRGDRVWFYDRFGKKQSGTIVFARADGYLTLNMGGRYGTPQVIHVDDVVERRPQRKRNSSTRKRSNPMEFFYLEPRRRNPSRRRRKSTRRRSTRRRNPRGRQTAAQRRASLRNLRKARAALKRRKPYKNWSSVGSYSSRRRGKKRRVKAHRRRTNPTRAASRRGGRKAARLMRRNRFGQFVGKKSRTRNPRRRATRRRRTYRRGRY